MLPVTAAAPIVTELPAQTDWAAPAAATGMETVTVIESDAVQPEAFFKVTLYCVVVVGATEAVDAVEVNPIGYLPMYK